MKKLEKEMRYVVKITDYHWDECWGVFDTQESCWVMKDVFKRHCNAKAKELNSAHEPSRAKPKQPALL